MPCPLRIFNVWCPMKQKIIEASKFVAEEIDEQANPAYKSFLQDILNDRATGWFFVGMALEALGVEIFWQLQMGAYPILDAIVFGIIGYGVIFFQQRRKYNAERNKD